MPTTTATMANSSVKPNHTRAMTPPSANTRAATKKAAAMTAMAGQQVSASGRR